MSWLRRRTPTELLVVAVLLLSAACCILAMANRGGKEGGSAVAAISEDPSAITYIALRAGVSPTRVRKGQEIRISAQIVIRGGPGPVTFAAKVPDDGGRMLEGSVTTMVDRNGVYGFELPPMKANLDPGVYAYTFRAFAGRVSSMRTVVLTVDPEREVFAP